MIEPEIAFADLNDDMKLAEDMLKYIIQYVIDECPEEMEFFQFLCRQRTAGSSKKYRFERFRRDDL